MTLPAHACNYRRRSNIVFIPTAPPATDGAAGWVIYASSREGGCCCNKQEYFEFWLLQFAHNLWPLGLFMLAPHFKQLLFLSVLGCTNLKKSS